jgi:hypothetical protein
MSPRSNIHDLQISSRNFQHSNQGYTRTYNPNVLGSGKHVTVGLDRSRNLSFEDLQAVQYLSVKPRMILVIDVLIQGVHKLFIVDNGASVSLVQSGASKAPLCRTTFKPQCYWQRALCLGYRRDKSLPLILERLVLNSFLVTCQYPQTDFQETTSF